MRFDGVDLIQVLGSPSVYGGFSFDWRDESGSVVVAWCV